MFSSNGTLISVSTAPHCGGENAGFLLGTEELHHSSVPGFSDLQNADRDSSYPVAETGRLPWSDLPYDEAQELGLHDMTGDVLSNIQ